MRTVVRLSVALAATLAFGFPARAHADVDLATQSSRLLAVMEGDAHHVASLLRTARASHAAGPAKCVDGYLSQIDTGVRHARDDIADIRSAIAMHDRAAALRAMGWLEARREAARVASFSADTCVVPSAAQDRDHTVVRVVVDPALPSDRAVFR